jgi:hypothetical protein
MLLEKLSPGLAASDLGKSISHDGFNLILDLSGPLVAGTFINAAVFDAPQDSKFWWTIDPTLPTTPYPDNIMLSGAYMSWNLLSPGFRAVQVCVQTGCSQVFFDYTFQVLAQNPRIQYNTPGTPEGDPISIKQFVYNYRHYILEAAESTGWPDSAGAICPLLIAAIAYREFLQKYATWCFPAQGNPVHQERAYFGAVLENVSPSFLTMVDLWTKPVGLCGMPLYLISLVEMDKNTSGPILQQLLKNIFTAASNQEQVISIIDALTNEITDIEENMAMLFNVAHFAKPNIRYAVKLLQHLRDLPLSDISMICPQRLYQVLS